MNPNLVQRVMTALAVVMMSTLVVVGGQASPALAAPTLSLTKSAPAEVLYGAEIPVTLTVRNTAATAAGNDGYNLTLTDLLPPGVSYVPGSSNPAPRPFARPGGFTMLVWENVSDSLAGTVVDVGYRVAVDPAVIAINSVVSSPAEAFVDTNPNNVPDIDPVTGAITGDFTQSAGPASASTQLIPFEIVKDEPSEEDELLRGVHDHQTVYTLTVNNNFVNPSTGFSIVDHLPAGLEFLGCGGVDNSALGAEEYPTSGRIDDAGNAPALANVCPSGANAPDVTTVFVDPDGAGPLPEAVYTRVEWSSADLAGALGSADLPASGTFKIDYVAAIPLRQNEMPSVAPFVSTANLDNNTGPLTSETGAETSWRNYTVATGSYNGGAASTDDDYEQVIAEDVSIHKRSNLASFEQGDAPVFTLFVESSEYARSTTPITVVDTLPATLDHVSSSSTPAFVTRTPTTPDATTSVVTWVLPGFTERSSTATITLTTSVRAEYRGQAGRPVSSSDDFTNSVALTTTSDTLTSLPGTPLVTTAIPVEDESSASLTAKGPTISKDVALPLPGNTVRAECGTSGTPGTDGNGDGLTWNADLAGVYRPGDLVCFRLRVQFPSRLDTIQPVVEDFLPFGFEYVSARLGVDNTVDPGPVTVTVDGRRVVFVLGDIDVGGKLLEGIVAARIVDPNAAQPGDIVDNLMKFRYQDSDPINPSIFQLREDASAEWGEPVLTLAKAVASVGVVPNTAADPVPVNEGDAVVYNVAVQNTGNISALDVSVRDLLPTQVTCSDVTGISNGGACTPGSPSRIDWEIADDIDIAPGATTNLTYTVTVPDGVTPGITLTNRAGVRDYRGDTNSGTPFTYVPASNIDTTLTPNTSRADDTAAIRTRPPTLTKSATTLLTQPGNTAGQATIGETIRYTVTATFPAGTSVTNASITDVLDAGNPTTGEKNLVASSVSATLNGAPIAAGAPDAIAFRLQVDDAGNRWTVTAPTPAYDVANGAGDTIVVTFDAIVNDVASNTRNTTTANTANLAYTSAAGPQSTPATVTTRIVEPNIVTTKTNDDTDGTAVAGQTIDYTVSVLNDIAGVPRVSTANDTAVVDTVPAELDVLEAPGDLAEDGDTIAPDGGLWDAGTRTITWTIPTINPGATATRTYQARTKNPLVAAGPILNTARATTTSYPGTPATPAGEPAPAERSPASPNGGPGSGYQSNDDSQIVAPLLDATKTGTPGTATVGEAVAYTVTATVPAGVIANDVTVIDQLPAGMLFESLDSISCTQGAGTCSLTTATVSNDGSATGARVSFFFDDITTPAAEDRVIRIDYTAVVSNAVAVDDGDTLTNGAVIYWNLTDRITTPPGPTSPPAPGSFNGNPPNPPPSTFDVDVLEPLLTIDKNVSGDLDNDDRRRAKPGDVLTYSLVVANSGTSPAYDARVTDTITTASIGAWNYSYTDVVGDGVDVVDGTAPTLEWRIVGPIPAGGSVTITYTLTVPAAWDETNEVPGGPELSNIADVPSYYGVSKTERDLNPLRSYREYTDVAPDDVAVELDLASIGDQLWFDVDGAGGPIKATGDPALAGVTVTVTYLGPDGVLGGGDDEVVVTATDSNGTYLVRNLPGGQYLVTVDPTTLPVAGLTPVYDLDAATAGLANAWRGTLAESGARRDVDFSYTGTGSIGDTIWFDRDGNGAKNDSPGDIEPGLADVEVEVTWAGPDANLTTTADNVAYTATTDADGKYLIENLPAGDYGVVVVAASVPTGYALVTDPDTTVDGRSLVTLDPGEDDLDQDFGYRGTGSIGDRIWLDQDGDGIQDAGEPGLQGVTVVLEGDDGTVVTVSTGADGRYLFDHLPPGEYDVTVTGGLPATVANTGDPDGPSGTGDSTSRVVLANGENDLAQDFGYDADSVLGDVVWWDLNRDGVQDPGEPGIPGVTVRASGPNGIVLTTVTDADGGYAFTNLPDGDWTVDVTGGVPAGFTATFDSDGGSDSTSDVTLATSDLEQDFGFAGTASIGDRVWLDFDRDGVQDAGEPGIESVDVTLRWAGVDGLLDTADDVVLTDTTDSNGEYLFPGLPVGDFRVSVDATDVDFPAGVAPTFDRDGGTATPDGQTEKIGLAAGEAVRDVDFGYAGGGTIGDTVWFDRDGDGGQSADEPGLGGVEVTLLWYGEDGDPDTTADNEIRVLTTEPDGTYLFTGLPEGAYAVGVNTATLPSGMASTFDADGGLDSISEIVLPVDGSDLDQDFGYRGVNRIGDTVWFDRNGDGTQSLDEPGIAGQTVRLVWTDAPGGARTFTTTTGPTGSYFLDNLPDGDFEVTVVGGIVDAAVNTGDPEDDSDSTSTVTDLGVGVVEPAEDLDRDFGYRGNNTIGDVVWYDIDADGVQDAGEPGLAGVVVTARWFGPDGVADTADDVVLPTVATGANGEYSFTDLPDGTWSITVGSGLPDGLDTATFDADDATSSPDGVSIVTDLGVGDTEPAVDLDQDFGYTGTGRIGETIWLDRDGDGTVDAGEPAIPGAIVTLTWAGPDGELGTSDDVVYATQTTGSDGAYEFGNLPAGTFRVDVANLPAGVSTTFDPDAGAPNSSVVSLTAGQSDLDQDFGYRGSATVGDTVWLDFDADGTQDTNEPGVPGILVTVTSPGADGTIGTADDIVVTETTDADGKYLVTGLPPGTTVVSYAPGALPPGYVPNSDLDAGDPTRASVELVNASDVRTVDFGVVGSATVTGRVWNDTDNDGVQDAGETGIVGVTVVVTWNGPAGLIVIEVTTDANGDWTLGNVPAGEYTAVVRTSTVPPGLVASTPASASVTVPVGGTGNVVHGFTPTGSIGDRVWNDFDHNGVQDPGEPGVPGVSISIRNEAGTVVATVVTDINGNYTFDDLPPGRYTVVVDTSTVPAGTQISADPDGAVDGNATVTLGPGQEITTIDFGISIRSDAGAGLPTTGAEVVNVLMLAVAALGLGWLLVVTTRRRRMW